MNEVYKNILYDYPDLYESLYPEGYGDKTDTIKRIIKKYTDRKITSLIDFGCGNGKDLEKLSSIVDYIYGIDFNEKMVAHAKSIRPHLNIYHGDMRDFRMNKSFDLLLCMGSSLIHCLTNTDIEKAFLTFSSHAHKGSLLIIDILNGASLLGDISYRRGLKGNFIHNNISVQYESTYSFNRRNQLFYMKRKWKIDDADFDEDLCIYRLLFPIELEKYLNDSGFKVLDLFDNKELLPSSLTGRRLFIIAEYS